MHVMLPLTKGHLSNEDRIIWQKGCDVSSGGAGLTLGCQSWGGLSPPTEKNGGEFQA